MLIVLLSLGFSFAITAVAVWLYERHRKVNEVTRVRKRIGGETEPPNPSEPTVPALIRKAGKGEPAWIGNLAPDLRLQERLHSLIESAGRTSTPQRVAREALIGSMGASILVFTVCDGYLTLLAIPAAIFAGFLPVLRLRRSARKRLALFESQFPAALEFISRSMRAGHAFSVSLEMLHREFEPPLSNEFRHVFEEQNLGMPLESALNRMSNRVHLIDVQFFVSAVVLQRKTGGNLTVILDTLAEVIRERYKLKGKVRAISAHGRMTATALSAIPIFVGGLMFFVNREYANFFFHTVTGQEMLAASITLQIVAYVVINKIVTIEV